MMSELIDRIEKVHPHTGDTLFIICPKELYQRIGQPQLQMLHGMFQERGAENMNIVFLEQGTRVMLWQNEVFQALLAIGQVMEEHPERSAEMLPVVKRGIDAMRMGLTLDIDTFQGEGSEPSKQ